MSRTHRSRRYTFFLGLLVLLVAPAVLSAFGRQDSSLVRIDRDRVAYSETIEVRFENTWGEPVAVMTSGCGLQDGGYAPKLVVEKEVEGGWKRAGAPICIAIATPPMRVAPGESMVVTLPVRLGLEASVAGGRFRYRFDIRTESNGSYPAGSVVALKYRTSPPFRIHPDR